MKFESLEMTNFMRYEGSNKIEFSCDPERNVTVVLGDNTVGKTTIAQAFRWGLYGVLMQNTGKEKGEIQLLNNDVAARLTEDTKASVAVEIVFMSEGNRYRLKRSITYTHNTGDYGLRETGRNVELTYSSENGMGEAISVESNRIDNTINEIMPRRLSNYFLFDGENWNDIKVDGLQNDIKNSVHVLTGLSSVKNAMSHLKDMGSQSVISRFRSNITGSGSLYDDLAKELHSYEVKLENNKSEIQSKENLIVKNQKELEEEQEELLKLAGQEERIKTAKAKRMALKNATEEAERARKRLVNEFSDKAYLLFAKPLIQKSLVILKQANMEKRDIPHMRQATIDYLINRKTCICGTPLCDGSKELETLLKQRDYLPPADLGSVLGDFEKESRRWTNYLSENYDDIVLKADELDAAIDKYREAKAEVDGLEEIVDQSDLAKEHRENIRYYNENIKKAEYAKGALISDNERLKEKIERIKREMTTCEAKTAENAKWKKRIQIAEELYSSLSATYRRKEQEIFDGINIQIQENFEKMFNEKEKRIELDKNYNIRMYYKNNYGYNEEKVLSEGEKVARNFAFIVTMMQCGKNAKDDVIDNDPLPIVLDGPFSKLSDENISLVSAALPKTAEQVIIFMLDKDWQYTGLDSYVGMRYQIDKNADANYASIRKVE